MMSLVRRLVAAVLIVSLGAGLLALAVFPPYGLDLGSIRGTLAFGGVVAVLLGVLCGAFPSLSAELPLIGQIEWRSDDAIANVQDVERRRLAPDTAERRQAYADRVEVPGSNAPAFAPLAESVELEIGPGADPMTPMYLLDDAFRILDWNDAFSIAFDRTMEGRRGQSVLEWTFLLDNYEQVLDHGVKAFSDEANLPSFDVERVHYTSNRYGALEATKKAYRIPRDSQSWQGWLVTLTPQFESADVQRRFQLDLFQILQTNLIWSTYALSYDALLRTDSYPALLNDILGESRLLAPIPAHARVLELGAGTGNVAARLADAAQGRTVVALENNVTMLSMLRAKCRPFLRADDGGPGLVVVKQDMTRLPGFADDSFDCAIMNNSLYSIDDPDACLAEVRRVLRPGGELRISGPKRNTNLRRLFRRFRRELRRKRAWDDVRADFERIERLNEGPIQAMPGFRWNLRQLVERVGAAGFRVDQQSDRVYAGQGMLVAAHKPAEETPA